MRAGDRVRILELSSIAEDYQGLIGEITAVERDFYIVKTDLGELACQRSEVELDLTKPVKRS